jgi:acetylornithine deacetylase/succinyl-diaminopimelate desuccinylase-like protein
VQNKAELLKKAEFLIDEGAGIVVDPKQNRLYYSVSIGEKSPLWLTLTFRGPAGHGSVPLHGSAVNKAIQSAYRILNMPTEFIVLPSIKEQIKMLLSTQDMSKIPGYTGDLETSLNNKTFLEAISKDSTMAACLKNTISITCLQGSNEINTIPPEASIGLDCRLLPGTSKDQFIERLKKIIQDEDVQIQIKEYIPCTSSPCDTVFIKALEQCAKKRSPSTNLVTEILLSSTDSSFYRTLGIHSYGFEPFQLTEEDYHLAHNHNERISVDNVKFGIALLTELLLTMQ